MTAPRDNSIERFLNAIQSREDVADDGGWYVTVVTLPICPSTALQRLHPRDKGELADWIDPWEAISQIGKTSR
jgi:hypothetical protein